jgi:hypothetical protein
VLPISSSQLADIKTKRTATFLLLDEPNRRRWFGDAQVLGQASGFSLVRVQPPQANIGAGTSAAAQKN